MGKPKAKKKIAIEEVDSSAVAAAAAAEEKPKAKKKIAIEEVDSSAVAANAAAAAEEKPKAKRQAPDGDQRKVPTSLQFGSMMAPKTGYEFEREIGKRKTPEEIAKYLDIIKPSSIPKLLSQDLNSDMMMTMVQGINAGLAAGAAVGIRWLEVLAKTNRFDFVVDFMSQEEKHFITVTINKLVSQGANPDAADAVRGKFKVR